MTIEISDEERSRKVRSRRLHLLEAISEELDRAYAKHGSEPWGRHEFYGILTEEWRELERAIFKDEPQIRVLDEMVQVAAMCFRYFETDDRYRGEHPRIVPLNVHDCTCPAGTFDGLKQYRTDPLGAHLSGCAYARSAALPAARSADHK